MFYSISVTSEKCCSSFMWVCIKIFFGKDFYFRCWNIEACLNTFVNYMCPTTIGASLIAQLVKNPPATKETLVWFLGQGDPLENRMTSQASILAWRIPCTEEPGGLWPMESPRVRHDWSDSTMQPVQHLISALMVYQQVPWCSCLERKKVTTLHMEQLENEWQDITVCSLSTYKNENYVHYTCV